MLSNAVLLATLLAVGGEEVVARVDAVTITGSEVAERRAAFRAQRQDLPADEVLSTLVDEALLAAEAERLGLRKDPAVAERLQGERRRLAADALFEAEFMAQAALPESALREMFHQTDDFVRVQLLTFETRQAAQASRERLGKGAKLAAEATQAMVARVYPSAAAAPWTMRAQLEPALAEAAFAAAPGALVGPIAMKLGFAVGQVLEVQLGNEATFTAKRSQLAEHARKKGATQARAHFTQQLRAKAGVTLDEAFLKGLSGTQATPADLDHVIATVNGRPLRYASVFPAVLSLAGNDATGHMAGPSIKLQLASQEVDARLLQDVAVDRGYEKKPAVLAKLAGAERNVLALAAVQRIRATAPAPSEAEIAAFYRENAARYGKPFEQVLPDVAARAAAQKREAALLERARELRRNATISIDKAALARAAAA
jgi:hypothetical protein